MAHRATFHVTTAQFNHIKSTLERQRREGAEYVARLLAEQANDAKKMAERKARRDAKLAKKAT